MPNRLFISPWLELILFAGLGAGFATVVNYIMADERSVLVGLSNILERLAAEYLAAPAAITIAAAGLVFIGGASIFYFRPLSVKGAFACGVFAIGALAILAP